ncbi:glycosyltransferase family 4 protein [Paenarthrobacter ilicis]|uniref:D-inositol 3-phosphate glycosyltransferase n=1 Tax=Paenarthrobacter ilicis TaxID=43665 RepID=A0ABX0TJ86_9MICC|nr:glycosyltransferase family 4 protein [Paenarthrobacter ilicis]MBM7794979.1 glycosyltransferase involved in cell wall biosynthesis [Paenarthrobacter ilicis]NIJ02610.1 glycosyltransferase involved in cell wall biosynthesis [Paenarthrobacter ilicis]
MSNEPLKIALFAHVFYPSVGGVEITSDILARGFMDRHGARVVVVTNTAAPDPERLFPYPVIRRPSPWQLVKLIRGADVVFHNNPAISLWWPLALVRKPWLVTLRMWITMPGQKLSGLERIKYAAKYWIIGRADVIAANSKVLADHVRQEVEVIPNSYRDKLFTLLPGVERDPVGVVYLGRLSHDKGVDLLIQAAARLVQEVDGFSLTIVGDGAERAALERLAEDSGLGGAVTFLGSLGPEESNRVLNRNSLVVIPSRMPEPFGTVAVEAAAAGCVVVYANHGGLPDAAGAQAVGFTPLDSEDLHRQLSALLREPEDVQVRREAAAVHAERHRESIMVDRYFAAVKRTLQEAERG